MISIRRHAAALIFGLGLAAAAGSAAWANGWEHGAIPFSALVDALGFGDMATRLQAAHSLGARGQKEAVPHLLGKLDTETDPAVRAEIYRAFGRLADNRALPRLMSCLGGEPRAELRAQCVAALGGLPSARALDGILETLSKDPAALVRMRAVDALGDFTDRRAVDVLAVVAAGNDAGMAARAVVALGRTGSPAAVGPLLERLRLAGRDEERIVVVEALSRVGSSESVEPLRALLKTADTPALRAAITVALGAARDGRAASTMVRLLGDPVPAVRFRALAALSDLSAVEAAPAVADLADDMAKTLKAAPVDRILAAPDRWLDHMRLLEAALRTVTELDPSAGLPAMLSAAAPKPIGRGSAAALALSETLYRVRRRALYGLGYSASKSAARFLGGPRPEPVMATFACVLLPCGPWASSAVTTTLIGFRRC